LPDGAGHRKAVTALAIDAVNRHLMSSSLDGTVKVGLQPSMALL